MRLNKYLADCGVGSRRACDKLIEEGKVKVNDKVATVTTQVEEGDKVSVNGKRVGTGKKLTYIMLHKPKGCVTTVTDDLGRKTVMDFVKDIHSRVYPVGRLDYDTEGLLLLTNDGDLANKLTHP
ncbi:MAG: rRNA pseudouridine synthase, partial [Clostridia bacterium]|nr:rRNA pseudouridine synthase [Clostridia bacterium]